MANEYTRARLRKHQGQAWEYYNALLYLQRIGENEWLKKFVELEDWLAEHPGLFVALAKYPSKHSKVADECRLGKMANIAGGHLQIL